MDPWTQEILSIFSDIFFLIKIYCRIFKHFERSTTDELWLLNVLRMIIIILTCYNWCYISNSLARQQLDLKGNFLRRGQIINSKIIQTDDQSFPTYQRAHFLSYISESSRKYIKYILRLSKRYQGPRTLGTTLSLRNLKRTLEPK